MTPRGGLHLPQIAGDRTLHALLSALQRRLVTRVSRSLLAIEMRLAAGYPALAFLIEGALLMLAKSVDTYRFPLQKLLVLRQPQGTVLNAQRIAAKREIAADLLQFLGRNRVETQLVEDAQQPGFTGDVGNLVIALPHLQRTGFLL